MLNNFIGGGQIFLHKIRMFKQVLLSTLLFSTLLGAATSFLCVRNQIPKINFNNSYLYIKATTLENFDTLISYKRHPSHISSKSISRQKIIKSPYYKNSFLLSKNLLSSFLVVGIISSFGYFVTICLIWSYIGHLLRSDKKLKGKTVLNQQEVARILKQINLESHLCIGSMPLVKNSETKHILVTGSTGSGKTNLVHNILSQVNEYKQPIIAIDQTGEMISQYYNPKRGDIIFNPFDQRGKGWDFWQDCDDDEQLDKFANILFGFNRRKFGTHSDPFWEQSCEIIFKACAKHLSKKENHSIEAFKHLLQTANLKELKKLLIDTPAQRYLTENSGATANSILSVLATGSKPLSYLTDKNPNGFFSVKQYLSSIKSSNPPCLFLSTKPSSRELTLPLISCIFELAMVSLINSGINSTRRVWFVVDELAATGNLPSLQTILTEGRKYGACVIAALQSVNQLNANYGHYNASTIFGQFATHFFFHNNELNTTKIVSNLCGNETIHRQQRNISFGASQHRDGQSYTELQQQKDLLEPGDLANLNVGECICLLPEPRVRVSKLSIPEHKRSTIQPGFIQGSLLPISNEQKKRHKNKNYTRHQKKHSYK